MDAKINKQRLSNLFSYDWLKIAVLIVASVFFWNVALSTLGTKPTMAQQMFFLYYDDLYAGQDSDALEKKLVKTDEADGVFSSEVFECYSLYLSSDPSYAGLALSMRMAAGQYSFGFASNTEREEGVTYLEEFLSSCYVLVEDLDTYFADAEAYFSAYYGEDMENGSLNGPYLEEQFRARCKGDKRYRSEKNIRKGLEEEALRIEKTKNSYLTVKKALFEGVISVQPSTLTSEETGERFTKNYSFDLGGSRLSALSRLLYREEDGVQTAKDVRLFFFRLTKDAHQYMRFEKLNYLAYLLDTYADRL